MRIRSQTRHDQAHDRDSDLCPGEIDPQHLGETGGEEIADEGFDILAEVIALDIWHGRKIEAFRICEQQRLRLRPSGLRFWLEVTRVEIVTRSRNRRKPHLCRFEQSPPQRHTCGRMTAGTDRGMALGIGAIPQQAEE